MTHFRTTLLALLLLALAVAGWAAFVLSRGADVSWARDWLAGRLAEALVRQVRIDGGLTLTLGRTASLEITGLAIANAEWGHRPHLAQAARALIAVELRSLWRGPLVIRHTELEGASVFLEHADDGRGNWVLGPEASGPADPDSLPVVEALALRRTAITYDAPALTRPVELRLAEVAVRRDAAGFLQLAADGALNEEALTLRAQSSPLKVLVSGRDVSLRLRADIDGVDVRAAARFDDLAHPERALADVRIAADDAARVGELLGLPDPGRGPLLVEAGITPQAEDLRLRLAGRAGAYDLTLDGNTRRLTAIEGLDMDVAGRGPDFSAVVAPLGWPDAPRGAFELEGRVRSDADSLVVERATIALADTSFALRATIDELPHAELRELSLDISGPQLERFRALFGIPGVIEGRFRLTADIEEDAGGTDRVAIGLENRAGRFRAEGILGPMPNYYGTELRMTGTGPSLMRVGQALGVDTLPGKPFRLATRLQWTREGLRISEGSLSAGQDRLQLEGTIARKPLGPGTALKFALSGNDLRSLGKMARTDRLPAVRYTMNGALARLTGASRLEGVTAAAGDARLRLDGRLGDPPALDGTMLRFDLEGKALQTWARATTLALPSGPFAARGELMLDRDSTEWRDVELNAGGASGRVSGQMARSLDAGSFDIRLAGPDLARLLPRAAEVGKYLTAFDFAARGGWQQDRWSFETARLRAGEDEVSASGVLDVGKDFSATSMPAALRIGSLRRTGSLFGLELPDLPLRARGTVSGKASEFDVADMNGQLGRDPFSGRLALAQGEPPRLSLKLAAQRFDLAPWVAKETQPGGARGPARDKRLIPDWPLPTAWLGVLDGDLDLQVAEFVSGKKLFGTLELQGRLEDRELKLQKLAVAGPIGRVDLQLGLSARSTVPRLSARGSLRDYSTFILLTTDPRLFDIDLHLVGDGSTLREVLGGLDGRVRAVGGPGRIPPNVLDEFYGDTFSKVFTTINPFLKGDTMVNSICTVLPLRIRSGVVSSAPSLISLSDKLNVIAHGTLNLRNERLDLNFKTEARKGIGVSAAQLVNPFIKVTGTLAEPRVTIDTKGTLVSGSAAVLTGGISILASTAWNRAFREKDPCAAVLKAADEAAANDDVEKNLLRRAQDFFGF